MAKIHILGGGTPTPTVSRFGSSYVVEVGGDYIMVDCGPATTQKLVKAGLWPTTIDYLFFTHHHFDHDVDYPCFLLCRWDQSVGKENVLKVFGPKPTRKLTEGIIGNKGLFYHDINARINHPASQRVFVNRGGSLPRKAPHVLAYDIEPGKVFSTSNWEITASIAEHAQPYLDCLAYRIDSQEGSIVFTGDTRPCESVINLAKNADIMFCMCWDHQEIMDKNGESIGQTGTLGAAQMAQEAKVRKLVLVHMGPNLSHHDSEFRGINEMTRIYDGDIVFSEELMSIEI
jgi:ribonuclease Z